MKRLLRPFWGRLPDLDGPGLLRVLRWADGARRVAAARELARRPEVQATRTLVTLLDDPVPGVRRAAARGLGWRAQGADALRRAAGVERTRTVALALAEARIRCGTGFDEAVPAALEFQTGSGVRNPERMLGLGLGDPAAALGVVLGDRAALQDERETAARSGDLQALQDLAALGDDRGLLAELRPSLGKRGDNARLIGLGLLGDPDCIPELLADLSRMDMDPARAFSHRRLASLSLGRLGVPDVGGDLVRALEVEALEHEGRPGAGLGIQYPVRAVLIWALGEIQADCADVLVPYLSNTHQSALGGFHLPAMAALYKLGDRARPALLAAVARGGEAGALAQAVLSR